MAAIGHLRNQLTPMRDICKQLKKEKDSAKKKVDNLEKNMLETMKKLQVFIYYISICLFMFLYNN